LVAHRQLRGQLLNLVLRPLERQLGLDAGEHHGKIQGLRHIVVRPEFQGLDHITALIFGGRHDDRQVRHCMALAEDPEDFQATDPWHHDVKEDHVEWLGVDHR
jgi:hypothetical protein